VKDQWSCFATVALLQNYCSSFLKLGAGAGFSAVFQLAIPSPLGLCTSQFSAFFIFSSASPCLWSLLNLFCGSAAFVFVFF